jgi:hypothetical protein
MYLSLFESFDVKPGLGFARKASTKKSQTGYNSSAWLIGMAWTYVVDGLEAGDFFLSFLNRSCSFSPTLAKPGVLSLAV